LVSLKPPVASAGLAGIGSARSVALGVGLPGSLVGERKTGATPALSRCFKPRERVVGGLAGGGASALDPSLARRVAGRVAQDAGGTINNASNFLVGGGRSVARTGLEKRKPPVVTAADLIGVAGARRIAVRRRCRDVDRKRVRAVALLGILDPCIGVSGAVGGAGVLGHSARVDRGRPVEGASGLVDVTAHFSPPGWTWRRSRRFLVEVHDVAGAAHSMGIAGAGNSALGLVEDSRLIKSIATPAFVAVFNTGV